MTTVITLSTFNIFETDEYYSASYYPISSIVDNQYNNYISEISATSISWNISAKNPSTVLSDYITSYVPYTSTVRFTNYNSPINWNNNKSIQVNFSKALTETYAVQITGYAILPTSATASALNIFQVYEYVVGFNTLDIDIKYNCEYPTYSIILSAVGGVGVSNKMTWDIISQSDDAPDVIAYNKYGQIYTLGVEDVGYNIEYITLNITPQTSDVYELQKYYYIVTLDATNNSDVLYTQTAILSTEDFPDSSIFKSQFQINNESILDVNNMYRVYDITNAYITAANIKNISILPPSATGSLTLQQYSLSNDISTYKADLTDFDYNLLSFYSVTSTGISNITLICSAIECPLWLFPHTTRSDIMYYNSISYWPSASFNIWPEWTWKYNGGINSGFVQNTITNNTSSDGVSSYGDGTSLTFFMSAPNYTSRNEKYNWILGDNEFIYTDGDYRISADINTRLDESYILSAKLEIFNNQLSSTMVQYHTADNGIPDYYPNINITKADHADRLFEHIKIYKMTNTIDFTINTSNTYLKFPKNSIINGIPTLDISLLNTTPITLLNSTIYNWTLKSDKWNQDALTQTMHSTPNTTYTIISGDGITPLTIANNMVLNNQLSCEAQVLTNINYYPYIWDNKVSTIQSSALDIKIASISPSIFLFNKYIENNDISKNKIQIETLLSYISSDIDDDLENIYWGDTCSSLVSTGKIYNNYNPTLSSLDEGWHSINHALKISGSDVLLSNCYSNLFNIGDYTEYNSDISRIYGSTTLSLPYNYETLKMGDNEIVTYDVLNTIFEKILYNIEYLKLMCNIYDSPPTELIGWLGYYNSSSSTEWRVNIDNINTDFNDLTKCGTGVLNDMVDIVVKSTDISENTMYIASKNKIQILNNKFRPDIIGSRDNHSIGIDYLNLVGIAVNSENSIFVADGYTNKNRITIYSFDPDLTNPWKIIYSFGGNGLIGSKYGFDGLNDIYIDSLDYLYAVDKNNHGIKIYSSTGSWIYTLDLQDDTYYPKSITIDNNSNMYILVDIMNTRNDTIEGSKILVYNSDKELINTISHSTLTKESLKIKISDDSGFLYIVYSDRILKIEITGQYAGVFANSDIIGNKNYTGIYHDQYKNFYIVNNNNIIRYIDMLDIRSILYDIPDNYEWCKEEIYIKSDEYLQDWVLNKSLARLWDIHEIFRRSLIGKIIDIEIQPNIHELHIRTFKYGEYTSFNWTKEQVYIGLNEMVASEVINRCIKQLYDNQSLLLDLIR